MKLLGTELSPTDKEEITKFAAEHGCSESGADILVNCLSRIVTTHNVGITDITEFFGEKIHQLKGSVYYKVQRDTDVPRGYTFEGDQKVFLVDAYRLSESEELDEYGIKKTDLSHCNYIVFPEVKLEAWDKDNILLLNRAGSPAYYLPMHMLKVTKYTDSVQNGVNEMNIFFSPQMVSSNTQFNFNNLAAGWSLRAARKSGYELDDLVYTEGLKADSYQAQQNNKATVKPSPTGPTAQIRGLAPVAGSVEQKEVKEAASITG